MSSPDRTVTDLARDCVALHNAYLPFRNEGVPFPPESLAFWCFLLNLQTRVGVEGKLLELGVQHGGTAFLSILSMCEADQQILVDLHRTDLFAARFAELPAARQRRTHFIEAPTASASTDHLLDQKYRFIHIDAGHTYDLVKADMERFAPTENPGDKLVSGSGRVI